MEENKIVEMGEKIIKFIESKYKIETYYTEYFHSPDKILKIVFNYNFYTLYDFDKQTLPIIACTGNGSLEDQKEFASAGMNEYILKPVNIYKVSSVLSNVLEISKQHLKKKERDQPSLNLLQYALHSRKYIKKSY